MQRRTLNEDFTEYIVIICSKSMYWIIKIEPKIHKGIFKDVPCLAGSQSFINYNCKKRSSTSNMAVWARLAVKKYNNDNC